MAFPPWTKTCGSMQGAVCLESILETMSSVQSALYLLTSGLKPSASGPTTDKKPATVSTCRWFGHGKQPGNEIFFLIHRKSFKWDM